MDAPAPPPVIAREIRLVDAQGNLRLLLSVDTGQPVIQLLQPDGKTGAQVSLDNAGQPAIKLENPAPDGPSATLEIDDKGAHVKFDRPGGASSYVFLNNAGASGLVLIDALGQRRLDATVAADGTAQVNRYDDTGSPVP